ncbi:MAG TPA: protein kinase [Candidatus Binatia bacterium]|nr:protein kinase [Candidatus Binatia bacterium]
MNQQIVSHYRIHEKLGAGGMGVVYKAEDIRLGRMVALKFLPEDSIRDPRALERFRREARAASALDHPNICTIYEIDEDKGHPFIAMQLLHGQTLRERIGNKPVLLGTLLDWALQIIDALQAAHAKGVMHRDIKPANIFITERGQAKILDFGLAKLTGTDMTTSDADTLSSTGPLTHTGAAIGTVAYMSPEQARGEALDARTDLFSFGVLLYEMATGKQAFSGPTWAVTVHAILGQAPMSLNESMPGLPQRIQEIIDRCLIKNRDLRYQSAAEIHHDLLQLKKDFDSGKKLKTTQTAARWTPRRKLMLAFGAAALLLVIAGVVWGPAALQRMKPLSVGESLIAGRKSVAVLPISVGADDPKLAAFGKGLLEDVAAKLSQLSANHDLEVIPARTLENRKITNLGDAVKEFGANLGLTVSLKQEDQLVRATYSLIDTKTDKNLAADSLTAPLSDLFTIEDKLTSSIANALNISLRTDEKQALAAHATTIPEAYQYFLEGQGYLRPQREALTSAEAMFQQALKLDPGYGPAEAGLGQAYWFLYDLTKQGRWIEMAQKHCAKAIELGNSGADGHACLGTIDNGTGKYEKAVEQFQQALQLDPANDQAYSHLAEAYQNLNQLDKAEEILKRRITVRPDYWRSYSGLGVFYFGQAEYEKAQTMFEKAVSLRANNYGDYKNLGAVLIYEGKDEEAIRALENSIAIRPSYGAYQNLGVAESRVRKFDRAAQATQQALRLDDSDYQVWGNLGDFLYYGGARASATDAYKKAISMAEQQLKVNPRDNGVLSDLADYYAMLGDRKQALDYLDRSLAGKEKDKDLLFRAALVYNQLHETGTALEWLRKALAAGFSKSVVSKTPDLDNLHDNPQYQALMQEK